MRRTRVPPNITRSTKLRGAQRFPKLAFKSKDFRVPQNLIFLAMASCGLQIFQKMQHRQKKSSQN